MLSPAASMISTGSMTLSYQNSQVRSAPYCGSQAFGARPASENHVVRYRITAADSAISVSSCSKAGALRSGCGFAVSGAPVACWDERALDITYTDRDGGTTDRYILLLSVVVLTAL